MAEILEDRSLLTPVLSSYLTTEHVDLNIGFGSGIWTLQPRNDNATPPVSYSSESVLLYAGEPSLTTRPAGSAFDFIGVGAGEAIHRLPQSQDPQLLYLGFAGYGVTATDFDRYNPSVEAKGRVSGLGRWLKVSLVDVQHTMPEGEAGDGKFSVWQSGDTGPAVFMSNYDDGVSNPNGNGLDATDGITVDDALWLVAGGHLHYNWGFTEPGRYAVTVKASGYLNDDNTSDLGQFVQSGNFTLYFSVGSVGQLEFDASTYSVNEEAGTASITVRRVNGSDGRITVNYATSNGTATGGADFTTTSGTLTFNDRETTKVITIPIINDSNDESNETVNLTLSSSGPSSINTYVIDIDGDANGLLGGQATATLTIIDNDDPANTPPTISDVANSATTEGAPTGAIVFTVGDATTPAGNLIVTATSSNTALVPNANIVLGGSGADRNVTLTPAASQSGTTTITLTVTDAGGLTATDTFVLTVTADSGNDAPSFVKGINPEHIGNHTGAKSFTGWAKQIDDGDEEVVQALTFQVGVLSGASIFSVPPALSADGTLSYTLNGTSGAATVEVRLTDDATAGGPALTTAAQTFTVVSFDHVWTPETGHTDVFFFDPLTTPGTLRLHIHSGSPALGGAEIDDTLFVANDTAFDAGDDGVIHTMFQLGASHTVLGGSAGDTVWVLPQSYTEYSPGYDRLSGVSTANGWSAMTLVLNWVDAPTPTAKFAIWTDGSFGNPSIKVQSTGDTTAAQNWVIGSPAHGHMNWGFTEPGLYVMSFTGQVTGPGGTLTSVPHTLTFYVTSEAAGGNNEPSFLKGMDPQHIGDNTGPQNFSAWATAIDDGNEEVTQALTFQVAVLSGASIFSVPPALSADGTLSYTLNGTSGAATVEVRLTDDATAGGPAMTTAAQTFTIASFEHTWTPITGHTDALFFDPHTTPGTLDLYVHSDAPELDEVEIDDTLFVASDVVYQDPEAEFPYRTMYQLEAPHPVLGGGAGDTVWVLPTDYTEFSPGYDASVNAPEWSSMTLVLNSVDAPTPTAKFTIWEQISTVRVLTTGDTTTPQTWNIGSPRHGHINWGFNEPGLYVMSWTALITGPGGTLTSVPHTMHFYVDGRANVPPILSEVADQTTSEGTPISIAVTIDDNGVVPVSISADSSNPTLVPFENIVINGSGANRTVTITPAADQFGTATIYLYASDGSGLDPVIERFELTVNPVNTPPTITAIADVVLDEDQLETEPLIISFTIGDAQTPLDELGVTAESSNYPIPITILDGSGANRTIQLALERNAFGEGDVTITVRDAAGAAVTETFHVTVNPVDDPPLAVDDYVFARKDSTSTLRLLTNDQAVDPDQTFTLDSFTQPTHGTVLALPNGLFKYTPTAGYTGPDSFEYTLIDNDGDTATATAFVTVGDYMVVDMVHTDIYVNYVNGEWYSNIKTNLGPGGEIILLDSDEGVFFANPSTRIEWPELPEAFNFVGARTGDDVWLLPEVFELDKLWLGFSNEGTPHETLASSIRVDLASFSGPGHMSMFYSGDGTGEVPVWLDTYDGVNSPTDAVLGGNSADYFTLNRSGHAHLNWTFTQPGRYVVGLRPTALVNGTDSAGNPIEVSSTGPITYYYFDVDALTGLPLTENTPQARPDAATIDEDAEPVLLDVLANDSSSPDPDEALAITGVTQGANGTVAIAADGLSVTYTPAANFNGADTFTYTITDEHGGVATTLVTVTVNSINDSPTSLELTSVISELPENTDTTSSVKVADLVVIDDAQGSNVFSLSGPDVAFFEIVGTELRLKAATSLDFETQNTYQITVNVDDSSVGGPVDASVAYTLTIVGIPEAPEVTASPGPSNLTRGRTVAIDPQITLQDQDTNDFGSSKVQVSIISGAQPRDRLRLLANGRSADRMRVTGSGEVKLGRRVIGTVTADSTTSLEITFANGTTQGEVQRVLRNVGLQAQRRQTGTRTVQFVVTDATGTSSTPITKEVDVG